VIGLFYPRVPPVGGIVGGLRRLWSCINRARRTARLPMETYAWPLNSTAAMLLKYYQQRREINRCFTSSYDVADKDVLW